MTAGPSPHLHLAAWSSHTVGNIEPNYRMGSRSRAFAGLCIKGLICDRSGIQASKPRDIIQLEKESCWKGCPLFHAQHLELSRHSGLQKCSASYPNRI